MQPEIKTLAEKKLIGMGSILSLAGNKTHALWQSFMQRRNEIYNNIGKDLYSMQVYDDAYFNHFSPHTMFKKWAAIEVQDFESVPAAMEAIVLPAGLYAVFLHTGAAATAAQTFQYILQEWLPKADFRLDNSRPHFEILGEKYKNNHPDSEECIWIPVAPKQRADAK